MPMSKKNKSRGQALVEFALAATLIFFLLAAAVDLGFMFFAVQGLHNAAQEGGTYGSRWLTSNLTTGARELNANTIRDNVRHESGSDRKSTRLNSSHVEISYAVFCLKKKKKKK